MKRAIQIYYLLIILFSAFGVLQAQSYEIEPNNSRDTANELTLSDNAVISAAFNPAGDPDYFSFTWDADRMYYLTAIESDAGVAPDLSLYFENNGSNVLTTSVAGRNGNNNFRLSGYIPSAGGAYYAKVFDAGNATGDYKIRLAGGRATDQLSIHEPDNRIQLVENSTFFAPFDTVYAALYPNNDVDFYRIQGRAGYSFTIGTMPILDLHPRDTDTFIVLFDSTGAQITDNDDLGEVNTPSGTVNCTFSKMVGIFPRSGSYYVMVRSYYNSDFGKAYNESGPGMGEYGLYYHYEEPQPGATFFRYPHIEIPRTNSVLVQWITSTLEPTELHWGQTPECENVIVQPDAKLDHVVKISGLEPQTKYYYQVITAEDNSAVEYFHTAKPTSTEQVDFFVISDSSPYAGFGSSPEQRQVAEQILKVPFDFGLHAGDVNQSRGQEYDLVYYQPYKDILKNATIFPSIGNHDVSWDGGQTYLKSYNLPHNNPDSTERYYSFNYGNVHCIALDTNIPYTPLSAQYQWLEQDLKSEMRGKTLWTFVTFHHPPWSEGWPGYEGETNVRKYLVPLFEKYHVDMIFNGHTHDYERGFRNGVYYIITGGGGCTLEEGIQAYDWDHVSVWINQHQFTHIRIDDKALRLYSINKDGKKIDMHSFEKNVIAGVDDYLQMQEISPGDYNLRQNYPNPFNGSTKIGFNIKENTIVNLTIYDAAGHRVRELIDGTAGPGRHQVEWDGSNDAGTVISSGIYFYRLKTKDFVEIKRMIFLK